jgi:transcriptional regulator with XRE-family HTH domain
VSAPVEAYFAEWLRTARARAGMSQQKVADALCAQGFTVFRQSTIGKIEAASRPVLLAEAVAMAELFGTTLDAALGLKPDAPQSPTATALAHRTSVLQQIRELADAGLDGAL